MRKETIIKYEKEFIAWCKGESVFLGAPTSMHDRNLIWREVKDFDDWKPLDTVYVLNDSYSIYRKALAEGKIVEVAVDYNDIDGYIRKCIEDDEFHHFHIEEIRIKPEEPKFKVGDWVRSEEYDIIKLNTMNVDSYNTYPDTHKKGSGIYAELWKPKNNEYFWYKNDLVKFDEIKTNCGTLLNSARGCSYYPAEENFEEYCEPFRGQLPTSIKSYKKD